MSSRKNEVGSSSMTRGAATGAWCRRRSRSEVVELSAVRMLVDAGTCAVACGGGGIPVARVDGRLAGVDAVIDKDRAQRCSPCRSTPAGC